MKEAGLGDRYLMPPLESRPAEEEIILTIAVEILMTKEGIKLSKSYSNAR